MRERSQGRGFAIDVVMIAGLAGAVAGVVGGEGIGLIAGALIAGGILLMGWSIWAHVKAGADKH